MLTNLRTVLWSLWGGPPGLRIFSTRPSAATGQLVEEGSMVFHTSRRDGDILQSTSVLHWASAAGWFPYYQWGLELRSWDSQQIVQEGRYKKCHAP